MMITDVKDNLVLQVSCQNPSKSSMEHLMKSKIIFFYSGDQILWKKDPIHKMINHLQIKTNVWMCIT